LKQKATFVKNFFHLLQTFHNQLPVTQYNAVNRLLVTETTNLSLGELKRWKVYIVSEGNNLLQATKGIVQIDILSITISNLWTVAWHFFFEAITCNSQIILKSNKVKVQVNGEKVTLLQVKSTLALEYFVTSKIKKVTKCYSSIVTRYFYSITGQVCHSP